MRNRQQAAIVIIMTLFSYVSAAARRTESLSSGCTELSHRLCGRRHRMFFFAVWIHTRWRGDQQESHSLSSDKLSSHSQASGKTAAALPEFLLGPLPCERTSSWIVIQHF